MDAREFFRFDLDDFDLNLIGFDCADELIDEMNEAGNKFQWHCPFRPGCGAASAKNCPAIKQRAQIVRAPKGMQ